MFTQLILTLTYLVFLVVCYFLVKKGTKAGGIMSFIVGILMILSILSGDIIDLALGLFLVSHSSKYLDSYKKIMINKII